MRSAGRAGTRSPPNRGQYAFVPVTRSDAAEKTSRSAHRRYSTYGNRYGTVQSRTGIQRVTLSIAIAYAEELAKPRAIGAAHCGCEDTTYEPSRARDGYRLGVSWANALEPTPAFDMCVWGRPQLSRVRRPRVCRAGAGNAAGARERPGQEHADRQCGAPSPVRYERGAASAGRLLLREKGRAAGLSGY